MLYAAVKEIRQVGRQCRVSCRGARHAFQGDVLRREVQLAERQVLRKRFVVQTFQAFRRRCMGSIILCGSLHFARKFPLLWCFFPMSSYSSISSAADAALQ